jgi:tetraacyldisaccharide 4'-kinase
VRATLERWLVARWYGRRSTAWLVPLELLFRGAVALRRALYARGLLRSEHMPVPVVVVGNLTVGGTGKTPLVLWLADALRARGLAPGIVSRGYGGAARAAPVRVDPAGDAGVVGDEALLLAQRSGCPVVVGARRAQAARVLVEAGVDVVIADDGLQHYALGRDVEILVLDGERGLGNGRCLPAGPLREPASRIAQVDAVVVQEGETGRDPGIAGALHMRLRERALVPLAGGAPRALSELAGQRVHAVAGIGNPERFFAWLRARGLDVIAHPHPDHAAYRPEDLQFGDELPVLMTEKDAVKCARFAGPRHWSVSVDVVLDPADAEALLGLVMSAVERKRP